MRHHWTISTKLLHQHQTQLGKSLEWLVKASVLLVVLSRGIHADGPNEVPWRMARVIAGDVLGGILSLGLLIDRKIVI